MKPSSCLCLVLAPFLGACGSSVATSAANAIKPVVVTAPVQFDTDDPAIWINPADRARSLVVGTDKDTNGALYVYDLDGKIVQRIGGLKRPNNVDIAYGLNLGGKPVDIAV
ncbi:MAG TPA: phytase, partial [Opitutaceae bacterium]|nr:phytase [Opitutaceae bacterium]